MQLGHSKVFLRRQVYESLEFIRTQRLGKSATVIQKHVRRFLAQIHYYDVLMAAVILQSFTRLIVANRAVSQLREDRAATKIQSTFRKYLAETGFMAGKLIAQFCQAYRRGSIARQLYSILRVERQVLLIQRCWRRYYSQSVYRKKHVASIVIQCCCRQRQARKVFRELRLKARDLDAIVAERDRFKVEAMRLKKEVEMLRQTRSPLSHFAIDKEVDHSRGDSKHWRSNQHFGSSSVHESEVDYLRMEVQRLQAALTQKNEILQTRRGYEQPPESVIVRKPSTWSFFGSKKDDAASQASSLGNIFSPQGATSRDQQRNFQQDYTDVSPLMQAEVTPLSWPSNDLNQGMFSSSVSLLDAERHTEIADYQLRNTIDSSCAGTPIYAATTMQPSQPIIDDEETLPLEPLEERHDIEFTDELRLLHQSIREQDFRRVYNILSMAHKPQVLVNEIGEQGLTALHITAQSNDLKIAKLLIDRGAVAKVHDQNGDTPLHLSMSPEMTSLLLDTGCANPNVPNTYGICALHLAVQRKDTNSVRVLLKHHAKVDAADNFRWLTPLHLATMPDNDDRMGDSARVAIVKLLCSVDDPDLNDVDKEGNTPLHYAVQIESEDASAVINALLEKGASPHIANNRKQEPLLLLCHNVHLRREDIYHECLHSMLYHGANPNKQSMTGATPLHLCLYHKDIDGAIQLISRAAELHLSWRKVMAQLVHL